MRICLQQSLSSYCLRLRNVGGRGKAPHTDTNYQCEELLAMAKEDDGRPLSDFEVRLVVERSLGVKTFEVADVRFEEWSSEPTGYCSRHLRVTVVVKLPDSQGDSSVLHFFAKGVPYGQNLRPEELREYLHVFRSEFVFFGEILPALGVAADAFAPRCCYWREDLLVLEDLSHEGYVCLAARDLVSFEDCAATLRSVALMHAASVAFEERQRRTVADSWPDVFGAAAQEEEETAAGDAEDWLSTGLKTLEFLADLVPPQVAGRETLKSLLAEKRNQIANVYNGLQKPSSRYRNVLSHGDIWSSNLLVKRSADGRHVDVKLIDFQGMCYAPLAYDVTFLIHLMSDRNFRKRHQESLTSTYYEALAESLKTYHIDVETIQTYDEFLESCDELRPHAIISAALYHPHVLLDASCLKEIFGSRKKIFEFMNLDREEYVKKCFDGDELYRSRVSDTFHEYVDWFYDQIVNKVES